MQEFKDRTVAEIVTQNIKASDVFKKYGIDFCCGGDISVEEACKIKGLKVNSIEREVSKTLSLTRGVKKFDTWSLDVLIDYIVETHHTYVTNNLAVLLDYTEKVADAHGNLHPEVIRIKSLTKSLVDELGPHLHKEERILFPLIKQLLEVKANNEKVSRMGVQSPIHVMNLEHEKAGDILMEISELSEGFSPPEGACNTFVAMYAKLKEFQDDLFQHIHLENNILFPKAIILEEELSL
jgi:regulator of cell morphogenesis and NO signaling